jgi:hypothetical protein
VQINPSDIPAIEDVDGDGDLDILLFDFSTAVNIIYHQNQSMEEDGVCGLKLQRSDRRWGGITECDCGVFAFENQNCFAAGRTSHVSGKSLLAYDSDADGDLEILVGEEDCTELHFMLNEGSISEAYFDSNQSRFPANSNTRGPRDFAAAYLIDIDFDGRREMVRAPNNTGSQEGLVDFVESTIAFDNLEEVNGEQFETQGESFLQNHIFDLGERALPVAMDWDQDGDQDLLISYRTNSSRVAFLENIGDSMEPSFEIRNVDIFQQASLDLVHIQLQALDYDFDGDLELVQKTVDRNYDYEVSVFKTSNQLLELQQRLNIDHNYRDYLHFADIDGDAVLDLLIGRFDGSLSLFSTVDGITFVETQSDFLGISSALDAIDRRAFTADLDQDGTLDLVTASDKGQIEIFWELDPSNSQILTAAVNEDKAAIPSGWKSSPLLQDMNDDARPDLILGMAGGGLQYFVNDFERGVRNTDLKITIFPNPASNTINVRSSQDVEIVIFDAQGKMIDQSVDLRAGQTKRLSLSLANGIYILRVDSGLQTISRRLLIH